MKFTKLFILMLACATPWAQADIKQKVKKEIDMSKMVVVLPFESDNPKAHGLPDATRTAVIQFLKDEGLFAEVLSPEESASRPKDTMIELGANLVDFDPGNMATRVIIGLGSGRAHAGFEFTVKDAETGNAVWMATITEKASFWSNSASSAAQRLELPEKIAKTLVKELKKAQGK